MSEITGKKKGGGSGRVAQEAPNTLISRQVARVIDVISEGEIEGLVAGAKSVYFDDTPSENADGSANFEGIDYEFKYGEADQTALKEWRGQESTVSVGSEATYGNPVTRTITDSDCDLVNVALRIPVLTMQDNATGDLNGNNVDIAWQVATGSPAGTFQTVHSTTIRGKCVAPYIRNFQIDLRQINSTGPYHLRLVRTSTDATETRDQRDTYFESYTKITQAKIKYNDTALLGVKVDAKQFGTKIPTRSYEIKGLKISVPANYDEDTRIYSGVWNGTFKTRYNNNPAWCMYDIISNKRYGLGDYIDATALDKYAFYEVAKYCDQLVPKGSAIITQANGIASTSGSTTVVVNYPNHNLKVGEGVLFTDGLSGRGLSATTHINNITHTVRSVIDSNTFRVQLTGAATSTGALGGSALKMQRLEPRFTMNTVIQSRQEAFAVLQTMASMFHGMLYFGGGVLVPTVDKPKDPVKLVTPANVKDGIFTYGGTNLKSRHSIVMVRWNDPENDYRQAVETYEDPELRERFGYRTLEVAAFGCTSRSQARRHGKWTLETEKLGETVTYTAGLDHGDVNPSDIISISDPVYSGTRWGGRVSAVNSARTQLTLDDGITSEFNLNSKTYTISAVLSGGSIQERIVGAVSTVNGKTRVTVTSPFGSEGIEVGAMWVIHGDAEERLWQVLNVSQNDSEFDIVAVRHDPNKFAAVDDIGYIDSDDSAYVDVPTVSDAAGTLSVSAKEYNYIVSGTVKSRVMVSWQFSNNPLVTKYTVFVTNNAGTYVSYETSTNSIEISDIKVGTYTFDVVALSETGATRIKGAVQNFSVLGKLLPPAAPTNLAATNGLGVVELTWDNPADVDLSYVEVWKADANNRAHSSAAVIKRTTSDKITIQLPVGTYYFWVRAIDSSTNPSDAYEPAGATAGVVGESISVTAQGTTLPAVNDALEGQFFFNTNTQRMYAFNGTAWVIFANDIDNTSDLTDGANLGSSAVWQNVSDDGTGTIPDNNATNNPVYSGTSNPTSNLVTGAFFYNTTDDKLYTYSGTQWIVFGNAYDNTNQLTDGANLGDTANWPDVTGTGIPEDNATNNPVKSGAASASDPTGSIATDTHYYNTTDSKVYKYDGTAWAAVTQTGAFFYNTTDTKLYTYDGSNWVVYANSYDNTNQLTDGANLGSTATWQNVTDDGTGTIPANNATNNPVSEGAAGASLPTSSLVTGTSFYNTTDSKVYKYDGTAWVEAAQAGAFFFNTTDNKLYTYDGSSWGVYANAFDNTNELTDGANLGDTAVWQNVSDDGTGTIPANNATNNPTASGTTDPTTAVTGEFFFNTTDNKLKVWDGSQWVLFGNAFDNTNQLTDGANLGETATWSSVTGTGVPANYATNNPVNSGTTNPTGTQITGAFFFNTSDNQLYTYDGSNWVVFANAYNNTNQLTDGASLGDTANWTDITGTPAFGDLATATVGNGLIAAGGTASIDLDGGSLITGTNGIKLNEVDGSQTTVSNFGSQLISGDVSRIAVTRAPTDVYRTWTTGSSNEWVFWTGTVPARSGTDTHIPFADLTGLASTNTSSASFIQINLEMRNPSTTLSAGTLNGATFSSTSFLGGLYQELTVSGDKTSTIQTGTTLVRNNVNYPVTGVYYDGTNTRIWASNYSGLTHGNTYNFTTAPPSGFIVVATGGFYRNVANKAFQWAVSGGMSAPTSAATQVRLTLSRRLYGPDSVFQTINNIQDVVYEVSGELGGLR